MNKYIIYCTPEQTKKALELGAPLKFLGWVDMTGWDSDTIPANSITNAGKYLEIPTSEEMLGFFRSKNIHIVIHKDAVDGWSVYGHEITPIEFTVFDRIVGFNSYEEAVLAAIDAALEYLENDK